MTYGDIFKKNEEQMSAYNFTYAQKKFLFDSFSLLTKDVMI